MFDRIHPLWGVGLRMKAHRQGRDAVRVVRDSLALGQRNRTFAEIEEFCAARMDQETLNALSMPSEQAIGDGTILQKIIDFINLHWEDLFALLMKLIGGMAMGMSIMGGPDTDSGPISPMAVSDLLARLRSLLDLLIPMLPTK